MDADGLSLIAGAILSLIFSYVPGLNSKFANLQTEYKRLIMLGLVVLTAGGIYGLSCWGFGADIGISVSCDKTGLFGLLRIVILSAVANQGTYGLTKS